MATYLLWAIAGFVLVIAELVTGTLYLLVVGVAALGAALVAFMGGAFWLQAVSAAALTLLGVYGVHRWWARHPKSPDDGSDSLDVGQTVVLEAWIDQAHGMARVKYRGSTWDAKVDGAATINDLLVIKRQQNGVLEVASA